MNAMTNIRTGHLHAQSQTIYKETSLQHWTIFMAKLRQQIACGCKQDSMGLDN